LNEAVHILNGQEPREVRLTNAALVTASNTESFAMPAEPAGEGEYLDILGVELAKQTAGLYRPQVSWEQEGRNPPVLKLLVSEPTGRALRLHLTQQYLRMTYADAAAPVGITDRLEQFLIKYAAGVLLEHADVYAANFYKQDTAVAADFRGRQQVIGRNLQDGALIFLKRSRPSTSRVRMTDARNYRR